MIDSEGEIDEADFMDRFKYVYQEFRYKLENKDETDALYTTLLSRCWNVDKSKNGRNKFEYQVFFSKFSDPTVSRCIGFDFTIVIHPQC